MAEITFLGLGLMGSALAETMVKAGHDTVVWNRTTTYCHGRTTGV
jgi:3-hydroxyisobutyrate dehydrogenase-like beta-hydroxyacid dehydrogenase